jgi:plastocyanin
MIMKWARLGSAASRIRTATIGVAVVLVVLTVLVVAACGGSTSGTTTGTPATAGAGSGAQVAMKNIAFDPATVTIKVGESVTWTNQDSVDHNVIADNGEFSSSLLAKGATFSFTFDTAGTYGYHCSIHPSMTGTVVVQ